MYKTIVKNIYRQSSYTRYKSAFVTLRNMGTVAQDNPVKSSIQKKLVDSFDPSYLEVINESYMHNVPKGAETHFKVVVVSDKFVNQPLLKRHQMINNLLHAELEGGVHALSIVAKTPDQWEDNNKVSPSPACRGGFGR
ncbi:DNA-binding transcriptional regulator BolA [Lasioglossum baleicum]|uniref:DNA-binding transcriptional regulator BolA n=1 Tax=Lasioglossum baleicum TaxID=434251 RepID=UPI003FCE4203